MHDMHENLYQLDLINLIRTQINNLFTSLDKDDLDEEGHIELTMMPVGCIKLFKSISFMLLNLTQN